MEVKLGPFFTQIQFQFRRVHVGNTEKATEIMVRDVQSNNA